MPSLSKVSVVASAYVAVAFAGWSSLLSLLTAMGSAHALTMPADTTTNTNSSITAATETATKTRTQAHTHT